MCLIAIITHTFNFTSKYFYCQSVIAVILIPLYYSLLNFYVPMKQTKTWLKSNHRAENYSSCFQAQQIYATKLNESTRRYQATPHWPPCQHTDTDPACVGICLFRGKPGRRADGWQTANRPWNRQTQERHCRNSSVSDRRYLWSGRTRRSSGHFIGGRQRITWHVKVVWASAHN